MLIKYGLTWFNRDDNGIIHWDMNGYTVSSANLYDIAIENSRRNSESKNGGSFRSYSRLVMIRG